MGTIGIRTFTNLPISAANMPPQLITISHSILPLLVSTPVTRPFSVLIPRTRVCVKVFTPRLRAPDASAYANCEGSTCPSLSMMQAPTTPSRSISGKRSCASRGEISCKSKPKVFAQPICLRISSIRSLLDANLMLPHSRQPGGVSLSSSSR